MKSLLLFFFIVLSSMSALSQDNIVSVVKSDPLDSSDAHTLAVLNSKYGEVKAVVLVEINGRVLEQKFIVRTQPCKCDPAKPNHYFFLTNNEKVVIDVADTNARLLVKAFDMDIPDDVAMKIAMFGRKSDERK